MIPIQSSRIPILLNGLKDRYEQIVDSSKRVPDTYSGKCIQLDEYHRNVSFFIHYIISSNELKAEFDFLRNYKERAQNEPDFASTFNLAVDSIRLIGEYFVSLDSFGEKCLVVDEKVKGNWGDPFAPNPLIPFINTEGLLRTMANIPDISGWKSDSFKQLFKIFAQPIEPHSCILAHWPITSETDAAVVVNGMKAIREIADKLKFVEEYGFQYIGSEAAHTLYQIYIFTNPLITNKLPYEFALSKHMFDSGNYFTVAKSLDCARQVYSFLVNATSSRLSKRAVINRFKSYMELYKLDEYADRSIVGEKEFQKKFEEFIFLHGLYPISEADIGNGRIDVLPLSSDEAFLCELKQVGFEKAAETDMRTQHKIEIAMQELEIYKGRLNHFPNLAHEVHVVIFSKKPLSVYPDFFRKNDIDFLFYVIDLSGVKPSKQSSVQFIDPALLF